MGWISKHIGHEKLLPPLSPAPSQREVLQTILKEAQDNVPFYKNRYADFLSRAPGMSDENFWSIFSKTPITTKQDLKDQNDAFTNERLNSYAPLMKNGETRGTFKTAYHLFFAKDFKLPLSTGGTSGTPTYRWLDYNDARTMAQSFLDSFHCNGWRRGESLVVYYPIRSYFTQSYARYSGILNSLFGLSVVPFEDITKDSVKTLLRRLESNKASLLVIFPCVLQRVAEIMKEEKLSPPACLHYINVSGEFFLDCSKSFIQKIFPHCRIENTYGAVEIGEIAHQNGASSFDYKVFGDHAYIEQGPDDTLLVTSLTQKAFPMIRYQMEDKGIVRTDDTGQQYLLNLEGKNTDYILAADGTKYYASFFNGFINDLNKKCKNTIIHFMLRYEGKTAQLNFVLDQSSAEIKSQIEALARKKFGEIFPQFQTLDINFPDHFGHDYTRKFKIISEGDGLSEVVGGYYKKMAG